MGHEEVEKILDRLTDEPLERPRDAKDRLLEASRYDPALHRLFDYRHAEMLHGKPMTDADFFAMVALTMLQGQRRTRRALLDHMNTCVNQLIRLEPASPVR